MIAGGDSACVAVAFSGGRDSTALLHATAVAAREWPGVQVVALHVHHGLSAHADDWLRHAQSMCEAWAGQGLPVRLCWRRVVLTVNTGDSVEAVARSARYLALQEMAREVSADMLLLAHHRQDQAETLLLQALRCGGVAGLAGMPRDTLRDGVRWARPWLDHPRSAIEAYVSAHGLPFIEDDSNSDPRYARNRLRLSVWPALLSAFPDAEACLASSARRLSDSLAVAEAWGGQVLPVLCPHGVPAIRPNSDCQGEASLDARAWALQAAPLRRESLRHWYRLVTGQIMSASWVERLSDEIPELLLRGRATRWPDMGLSLYRGELRWRNVPQVAWGGASAQASETSLAIEGPGSWHVPAWHGTLRVREVTSGGMPVWMLQSLTLRARQGGEQFQMGPGRPPRSLKKQFQALGVSSWSRGGPLVWVVNQLAYVPGLGMDARVQAATGVAQCALEWCPDEGLG